MADESLIPKRPVVKTQYLREGVSVFFRLAVIFFIASAIFSGVLYFYKNILSNGFADQQAALKQLEIEFEPSLITELDRVATSIAAARDLVGKHVRQTAIFALLQENALPAVTFTSLSYNDEKKSLVLTGDAASYGDISNQSSVFESLSNVTGARFSNLALRESGRVSFNLTITFK